MQFDVVIVGSGPAGVHAAYPLVNAGLKVAIIDGGLENKQVDKKVKRFSIDTLSQKSNAYDLLQADSYVFNKTYELLKLKTKHEIIQSLAKGGLSSIWHGICDYFSKEELEKVGLWAKDIFKEYEKLNTRIKITTKTPLDVHSTLLLNAYKKKDFPNATLYPVSLTFPYNTSFLIEQYQRCKNFSYIPHQLVTHVRDTNDKVEIESFSIDTLKKSRVKSKYLILAAGSINTTRILLRSFNLYNYKAPFLTKAQYIVVCLHPRMLLHRNNLKKTYGQVVLGSNQTEKGLQSFFIQVYKLNPNKLHVATQYVPLPKVLALRLLSMIAPFLVIVDIRFPSIASGTKFCRLLKKGEEEVLEIACKESKKEVLSHKKHLKEITKQISSLGLYPVKVINSGFTTAHYAGGVPIRKKPDMLSADKMGKLHQADRIYIADSSIWNCLPAKPPTFTIIAAASRVGKNVLRLFQ